MGHKDLNGEEGQRLLSRRRPKVTKVHTDHHHHDVDKESLAAATPNRGVGSSGLGLSVDKRWIIDPNQLKVGTKIGEGSHGKVYEGRYFVTSVAIKVLRAAETSEEQMKLEARFDREVAMMSRVQHKNLVTFIGACKDPVMAIATELLPGRSLRKHLLSLRPNQLELHVAISFAMDIAHAMDCLHINGIIHRDLKPDNLLLTADQKSLKLIDFGLAREESITEMMTAETGTYRWMAPELYSTVTLRCGDKKHYNNKVDVYSFAIVLWELVTNRMPFEGMSNLQAAYAAAFKNMRPSVPDGLPEELVLTITSCWAEDPNVRPNFGQVIRMLNAALSSLPAVCMPPSVTASFSKTVKESPNNRLVKSYVSDGDSPKQHKDDYSDGGSPAKPKRRFLCFGHCFASSQEEQFI